MSLVRHAYGTNLELRSEEERIIGGPVVPFDTPTKIGRLSESFARGAFDGTDPASVPLLVSHQHASLPIGRTLTLREDAGALVGEWHLSETRDGDEVLALARDGVPLGLSVGFAPIEDRWSPDRRRVTRLRARLGEVSVVGVPAYAGAQVTSVRAARSASRLRLARLLR